MRTHIANKQRTRTGVLWIHSAPLALQPHLTWAIARLTLADGTKPGRSMWRTRKQSPTCDRDWCESRDSQTQTTLLCTEIEWTAELSDIDALVDDLSRWPRITFELAVDAPGTVEGGTGMRYLHTPELGTFAATTDDAGNILLNEERLRAIMARSLSSNGAGSDSYATGVPAGSRSAGNKSADSALADALDEALGGPWDRAIEPLRPGTAGFDDDFSFTAAPAAHNTKPAPIMAPAPSSADYASENVVMLHPRRAVM